jgi:histone H1/5
MTTTQKTKRCPNGTRRNKQTKNCEKSIPSYYIMAREAIVALKERSGSSIQSITAYIRSKYPMAVFNNNALKAALEKGVDTEKLIKIRRSYKMNSNSGEVW